MAAVLIYVCLCKGNLLGGVNSRWWYVYKVASQLALPVSILYVIDKMDLYVTVTASKRAYKAARYTFRWRRNARTVTDSESAFRASLGGGV